MVEKKYSLENAVNTIGKELNPAKDFDNIKFYNHTEKLLIQEGLDAQVKNISNLFIFPKFIMRGGVSGGIAGAISSYVSGTDLANGVILGSVFGSFLDLQQFMLRSLYHYTKEQISPSE